MKLPYRMMLLAVFVFILIACAQPAATTTPDWQSYSNPEAGFSIRYPATWTLKSLPDQNSENLHGVSLSGAEGGIELYWGVGLGGGCALEGIQNIKVAQGELQACYSKNADGAEQWQNISKALPTTDFSARAYTTDTISSSHDLVLQVISTLSFP